MNRIMALCISGLLGYSACSGGSDSGPTGPEVPPAPQINGVSPNPVRAGETLIISGANLQASQIVIPAQQAVEVLLDGNLVSPISASNTEVQIQVPLDTSPGNHTIAIRVGGRSSNSIPLTSEIFTATGTYMANGTVSINSCLDFGVGNPVGTAEQFQIVITDDRPNATGRVGAIPLSGTLSPSGSFNMSMTEDGITSRVEGNLLIIDGDVGFSGRVTLESSEIIICSYIRQVTGVRVSTTPTAKAPSANNSSNPLLRLERTRQLMLKN